MSKNTFTGLSNEQNQTIAERLVFLRTEVLHLNQLECANALDVSQTYLSMIETEKRPISKEIIDKYVKTFNINHEWLITGNNNIDITTNNSINNACYHIHKKQNDSLKSIKEAYTLDKDEIEFISHLLSLDKTKRKHFIRAIHTIKEIQDL